MKLNIFSETLQAAQCISRLGLQDHFQFEDVSHFVKKKNMFSSATTSLLWCNP